MIRRTTSVLVVEDNLGDARLIQEYLRESETLEAEIKIVTTLAAAVEFLQLKAFDIVLLDLSLSDSSGLGSVRVLTRTAKTTPIVVLSGNEDYSLILQSVQAGAQDYLPKQDVSTGNLSRSISSAIERQAMLVERETLATIGRIISSNLDIEAVFGKFAELVRTLIPIERMVVSWVDDEEKTLVNRHTWGGANAPGDRSCPHIVSIESLDVFSNVEDGSIGWGLPMVGLDTASQIEQWATHAGYNSAMFAPLRAGDSTGGVISVVASDTNAYTDKHLQVFETIASQISGAIHASELYGKAVLWTEEREQRIVLEAQKQELERISRVKSQILATVSHELKTPLTSMAAFIDILSHNKQRNLAQRQLDQLEVLRRNGAHLHLLINDLLDHSRVESGTFELLEMNFDANAMLRALGESFEPLVTDAGQTITVDVGNTEVIISADQNRISQTISNLLSNATKYAGSGANIRLESESTDTVLTVAVVDDGIGMESDVVENAFDIYFRGENPTTRAVSGLGLGLNIAQTIIKMHDGEIFLSSELGIGTRIGFNIPRVVKSANEAA
ncbi:MAG: response regulator [Chloroflexi bacterium]|jgi:signal transduction histidine kinase/CheY-like chemotaxis protein|nr:response regulator [Chloroflexota bacterium]